MRDRPDPRSGMDFSLRDLLTILFRRRRPAMLFFLTVIIVVLISTILTPPFYQVTAAILVKTQRAETLPGTRREVTEGDLNTEIEILKNRQLLEQVLLSLEQESNGDSSPLGQRTPGLLARGRRWVTGLLGRPRMTAFEQNVLRLQRQLSISPLRNSSIIQISYESEDPEWATKVVRTLTDRYLAWRSRVFQPPQTAAFFEEQLQMAKQQLQQAEAALGEFVEKETVTMIEGPGKADAIAQQKSLALGRLDDVEKEIFETESVIRQQENTVASLSERLAQEPERLLSSSRQHIYPAVEEIERELVHLLLERDNLLQSFEEDNRLVRDIDRRVELAMQHREEARRRAGGIDGTDINPVHQDTKAELYAARTRLEAARGRRDVLEGQIRTLREQLDSLNRKGFTFEKLYREAKAAEEKYLFYREKHEEARISTAMDDQNLTTVSVAQEALKPLRPVGPSLTINLLLAMLLGGAGGIIMALVLESLDHTFTTGVDLEHKLGLPHLASVPESQ
ncbi:MAG TPA: Wzz/FepE/Etk N-terminal domain-containing protein [Vicinamibacteria bacterium]|nr:Wzz/FepE/Etk N-terminal domain-containing protein [Vicinamibacteria bacterium]